MFLIVPNFMLQEMQFVLLKWIKKQKYESQSFYFVETQFSKCANLALLVILSF